MKKLSFPAIAVVLAVLSGCFFNPRDLLLLRESETEATLSPDMQLAIDLSQQIMDCFINKDADTLYSLFSPDAQQFPIIKEQIDEAMNFINGNIISYELPTRPDYGGGSWEHGVQTAKSMDPEIDKVITDTGYEYRIGWQYFLILRGRPDEVGLTVIGIRTLKGNYIFYDDVCIGVDSDWPQPSNATGAPDARAYVREVMRCIEERDAIALRNKFCNIIEDSPEIDAQIEELFDFIDGNVVHYDLDGFFEEYDYDDSGNRIRYSYCVRVRKVDTDSGKSYVIRIYFELKNDGRGDRLGISELRAERWSRDKQEVKVGDFLTVFPEYEGKRADGVDDN